VKITGVGGIVGYTRQHNMETLAAETRGSPVSGGVMFARTAMRNEKEQAREQILELFLPERWSQPLFMLTMPGVHWRFERLLLGRREVGWMRKRSPSQTHFTSAENDRAIYFAAAGQIPGLHTPDALLKKLRHYPFAEYGIKTRYGSFFFANIDDMLAYDWNAASIERGNGPGRGWDAVWLDYTGPMSIERLNLIATFYQRYVKHILIITALKARWNRDTSAAVVRAGGHSKWLCAQLPGDVLHDIEYQDTVPMAQIAIRKHTGLWFWKTNIG
jgi:hypothetical protein